MSTQKHYNNLTAARLCLSGALFVALTFVKLLLPEQTAALRAELREAISRDADYSEALLRLGSALGGADAAEPVLAALGLAAETPAPSEQPAVSPPPEADSPPSPTPAAEPTSAPHSRAHAAGDAGRRGGLPREPGGVFRLRRARQRHL